MLVFSLSFAVIIALCQAQVQPQVQPHVQPAQIQRQVQPVAPISSGIQFKCPPADGFYPDPNQCDKYYVCFRGEIEEKLCPDGLIFDHNIAPKVEQCNYPFIVECPEHSALQEPKPSGIECPRQNGYFEHEDPSVCEEYYECTNGIPVKRTCHTGLVFDEFTGSCQWKHSGIRQGCGGRRLEVLNGFSCPNQTQLHTNGAELDHGRYVKDGDCRFFYVCNEGKYPREVGCPVGTVFNDITLNCDDPINVPGCEDYYAPLDTEPVAQPTL